MIHEPHPLVDPFFSTPEYDDLVQTYRDSFSHQDIQAEELKSKWVYRIVWTIIGICMFSIWIILLSRAKF